MSGLHDQPDHATNLTPEEREGLIPAHVTTREELNEVEQQNIVAADIWAFARKRPLTTERFIKLLHRRMFVQVWRWAGAYRTTGKNIGVDPHLIQQRLYETMEQFQYWMDNKTFPPDEIAVRLHHALVLVHPFANGNGRWSRLMADLLAVQLGQSRFGWGSSQLRDEDGFRKNYIDALRAADRQHDFGPLLAFARS